MNNVLPVNGEHRKRSVLVVDDNLTMRSLLKHVLKTAYEVETASCVDEALRMAQERRFDGLLLDIQLGEPRTGIDLLLMLRQMPAYREVPAVACTAFAGDRERIREAGFDECVEKPFTKEQLHAALERAFNAQLQSPRL